MRTLRWTGLGLLLLLITGCIRVDQTLSLNADGSGRLHMRYGMAEQTIAQLEAMEQMSQGLGEGIEMQQQSPFEFDEEAVREQFEADKPAGVELVSVSSEVVDGWKYIDLTLEFDDLRALKKTELFQDSQLSISREDNGNYVLEQKSAGGEDVQTGDPRMQQQMAAMFAGLRIANSVVVPGEVIETNATAVNGNRVSWVFDIDKDPDVIAKLQDTDLRVVFAGDGIKLPTIVP